MDELRVSEDEGKFDSSFPSSSIPPPISDTHKSHVASLAAFTALGPGLLRGTLDIIRSIRCTALL